MPVRFAVPEDAAALIRLNAAFNGPGMEDIRYVERSLRENPNEIVCIAELDGEPAGFCCAQLISSFCYRENPARSRSCTLSPAPAGRDWRPR
jgi:hypothetical protein